MRSSSSEVYCDLTPRAFRVLWVALLSLYVFVTLYLFAHAAMYAAFYVRPISGFYTSTFQLLPASKYPLVSAAYAGTALLYTQQLFQILQKSLRDRRLRFVTRKATSKMATNTTTSPRATNATVAVIVARKARRLYAFLFAPTGVLSVRGPFFEVMTLLREMFEIAVQVFQAYESSRYTTSHWINLAFGALIVMNCISTPCLHRWFFYLSSSSASPSPTKDAGAFRLVVLAMDLALDLVWFLVLPFLFWAPYYAALRGNEALFYDDTFLPKALMELRFIFVTSLSDLVFVKLLSALSVYFALRKVQFLVRCQPPQLPPSLPPARFLSSCVSSCSATAVVPSSVLVATATATATTRSRSRTETTGTATATLRKVFPRDKNLLQHVETALTTLLSITGCVAVGVYFLAFLVYRPQCAPGCHVVLRPWFVTDNHRCFCAVQEINCHLYGIRGSAQELTQILSPMESHGLLALTFTHCSELSVPPSILRFYDLYQLEIFNCSITHWAPDAAITSRAFPQLGIVLLVATALTEIPFGLLQGDLPKTLRDIQIVDSHLATLPLNLGDSWPHVTSLYLERAKFQSFPAALSLMPRLESLSLYGNNISMIPDDALHGNAFVYLMLTANPLVRVPASLHKSAKLTELQLMNTSISTVMDAACWAENRSTHTSAHDQVEDATVVHIYGHGSPFCDELSVVDAGTLQHVEISCAPRVAAQYNGESSTSWYPLEGKWKERRLTWQYNTRNST